MSSFLRRLCIVFGERLPNFKALRRSFPLRIPGRVPDQETPGKETPTREGGGGGGLDMWGCPKMFAEMRQQFL